MWATMESMTSKAPLIALVSLAALTTACSSSISLTDEPAATLGTPETTIVSTESSAPEQTSAPSDIGSGDTDTTESSTPETTAPEQDAESTTTTVEPTVPAEPELDPEIAAARDDLQSQYASSRLYG